MFEAEIKILDSLYELLSDPSHWTKGVFAKKSKRSKDECNWDDPEATCFCLYGAFERVTFPYDNATSSFIHNVKCELENEIFYYTNHNTLIGFNDDPRTKHKSVLNVIKGAKGRFEKFRAREVARLAKTYVPAI